MPFPLLQTCSALLCASLLALAACSEAPRLAGPREVHNTLRADFKIADANSDEQLASEEMTAGLAQYLEKFDEIDTDQNKRINFAELWSYAQWRHLETEDTARARYKRR